MFLNQYQIFVWYFKAKWDTNLKKKLLDRILTKLNHGFLVVLHRHEKVPSLLAMADWKLKTTKICEFLVFFIYISMDNITLRNVIQKPGANKAYIDKSHVIKVL